jgi:aerobic carbon-monoxide dehydrogenase medium subunit
MKPPRFAYHAPTAVEEATGLLADYSEDAKVLAGGQSLIPLLSFRLAAPGHLIDINRLPGLDQVERTGNAWRIGALVRQRTAERSAQLAAAVPLLPQALANVAHPQIRNRGTICGSLAHGDSSAELPAVMTALDARMTLLSVSGTRQVAAGDFFQFHLTTAIEPGELLTAVEFDSPAPRTYAAFEEFALRRGDFALAGVAATATFAADNRIERCRVVAAGVAPTPLRLATVEELLTGSELSASVLAAAKEAVYRELTPVGDSRADSDYRRHLLSVLVRRALSAVLAKHGAEQEGERR